jgi:tRNA uridine 5-carboxymethylaminomethyl modification enzyme
MVSFFRDAVFVGEANPILADTALILKVIKCLKSFLASNDLEDIMKFDKAKLIKENDLDQEKSKQNQVKYSGYIEKERNNADKLKG